MYERIYWFRVERRGIRVKPFTVLKIAGFVWPESHVSVNSCCTHAPPLSTCPGWPLSISIFSILLQLASTAILLFHYIHGYILQNLDYDGAAQPHLPRINEVSTWSFEIPLEKGVKLFTCLQQSPRGRKSFPMDLRVACSDITAC